MIKHAKQEKSWHHTHYCCAPDFFTVPIAAVLDLKRQQNLAKEYAEQELQHIISTETLLDTWNLPSLILGEKARLTDTDFTFKQWVVTFVIGNDGFVQTYVKPSHTFFIPVLNFKNDFTIDHISFTPNKGIEQ